MNPSLNELRINIWFTYWSVGFITLGKYRFPWTGSLKLIIQKDFTEVISLNNSDEFFTKLPNYSDWSNKSTSDSLTEL